MTFYDLYYKKFYDYMYGAKIRLTPSIQSYCKNHYYIFKQYVGLFSKTKGLEVDTFYSQLCFYFPEFFDRDVANIEDQLDLILETYSKARELKKDYKEGLSVQKGVV